MLQRAFQTDLFPTAPEGDLEFNNGAPGSAAAAWLRAALEAEGFSCGEPSQEDYGWGFWLNDPCMIWVFVSHAEAADETPAGAPPEWIVGVSHERPIFAPSQWFKRAEGEALAEKAFAALSGALAAAPGISLA
ncbi:hypothetical protein [Methylocystis parvus]|uniref:hypothetical protein n=1 Tax=Methylocystis parvus TaxID=134 RepID=UPI003C72B357